MQAGGLVEVSHTEPPEYRIAYSCLWQLGHRGHNIGVTHILSTANVSVYGGPARMLALARCRAVCSTLELGVAIGTLTLARTR